MNILIFFVSLFVSFSYLFDSDDSFPYKTEKTIEIDSLLYPTAKHREQSKLIYQLLSKYHYKKINVDDSLSEKILDKYLPEFEQQVDLKLPKLKSATPKSTSNIKLPKLKKK